MSVCKSVSYNFIKGGKLHSHAPIGALVMKIRAPRSTKDGQNITRDGV